MDNGQCKGSLSPFFQNLGGSIVYTYTNRYVRNPNPKTNVRYHDDTSLYEEYLILKCRYSEQVVNAN